MAADSAHSELGVPPNDEGTAEASAEHRAQGRADALLGFSETRNPWPEGTRAHASYRDGWIQGEAERQAAAAASTTSGKRRRRRRANGETEPETLVSGMEAALQALGINNIFGDASGYRGATACG
jgi:hypothetical protein